MSINAYVRETKLHDVRGRVDYTTNSKRQRERLIMAVGALDRGFWKRLAADCQSAFKPRSMPKKQPDGTVGLAPDVCCEGRELMAMLPNCILAFSKERQRELLMELSEYLRTITGSENVIALHDSHAGDESEANVHLHMIFAERRLLPEPETIVAERNLFYDETGKRYYKKSEILDENNNVRPGCKIVPKGTVLGKRYFGSKLAEMKSQSWLHNLKLDIARWINVKLEPDEQRVVYDPYGPYLAQRHIGKRAGQGQEEYKKWQEKLRRWNGLVKAYNAFARNGEIPEERLRHYKTRIALSPDRTEELTAILAEVSAAIALSGAGQADSAARTRQGRDEGKKRQLREAYRRAALLRKECESAAGGRLDQMIRATESKRELKELSAAIDRLCRELGYDLAPTVYGRKRAVWDGDRAVKGRSPEYWERQEAARIEVQKAKKLVTQAYEYLRWANGWWVKDPKTGKLVHFEGYYEKGDPRINEAKEKVDKARLELKEAKAEMRVYPRSRQLLAEYRAYALELAGDPAVPKAEADRARERYLAAKRRLAKPTRGDVSQLRHQLGDLKKSVDMRMEAQKREPSQKYPAKEKTLER